MYAQQRACSFGVDPLPIDKVCARKAQMLLTAELASLFANHHQVIILL